VFPYIWRELLCYNETWELPQDPSHSSLLHCWPMQRGGMSRHYLTAAMTYRYMESSYLRNTTGLLASWRTLTAHEIKNKARLCEPTALCSGWSVANATLRDHPKHSAVAVGTLGPRFDSLNLLVQSSHLLWLVEGKQKNDRNKQNKKLKTNKEYKQTKSNTNTHLTSSNSVGGVFCFVVLPEA
jgi:hypothetical protein